MLFSSIPFLYYFFPAVILLYFIAPKRLKNTVLQTAVCFVPATCPCCHKMEASSRVAFIRASQTAQL